MQQKEKKGISFKGKIKGQKTIGDIVKLNENFFGDIGKKKKVIK